MKSSQAIFFVLLFVLCTFFVDREQGDNSLTRAFTLINIVDKQTFSIDNFKDKTGDIAFVNGHYYSDKAPLPTLIAVPFYALDSKLIRPKTPEDKIKLALSLGTFFCSTLPFFFIICLIIGPLHSKQNHAKIGIILLSIFSCFMYSYASAFWGHMLTALFLLMAYKFMEQEKYYFAGIAGGAAFACEYMYAIVIACWILYFLIDTKKIRATLQICVACLPGICLVMLNNYLITSNPLEMTYKSFATEGFDAIKTNYGFSLPMMKAIYGLSLSDYRGILWYLPILFPLLLFSYKEKKNRMLFISLIIFFLALSAFHFWHGGWAYGPRYLLPLSVVLLYAFSNYLRAIEPIPKWLIAYLSSFFVLHFLGRITTGNSVPTSMNHPFFDVVFPQVFKLQFNHNNVLSICFQMNPFLANLLWLMLFIILFYLGQRKEATKY